MSFGRYRLLSQLGAGRDGVRYRAVDREDGTPVEVRVLTSARKDPAQWASLVRRLRLAAMIDDPSALRIVSMDLDGDSPLVTLEWVDAGTLSDEGPELGDPIAKMTELALAVAAGHRLGLTQGKLAPGSIQVRHLGGLAIDWSGLHVEMPTSSRASMTRDEICQAPEIVRGAPPDFASDLFALGVILKWRLGDDDPVEPAFTSLLRELMDEDPANRPTVKALIARLNSAAIASRAMSVRSVASSTDTVLLDGDSDRDQPSEVVPTLDRERLGRFRLIKMLGQGGMGTVYRAEDLSDGSIVAIKVLKPALASRPESLRRFLKEARLLAEVKNPQVANFIEVNEDEGVHYLALEFVDGCNLAEWTLGRGPLAETLALSILADVARGLEGAHARGIVHRDIKPENIVVIEDRPSSTSPRVKLLDFGLARHVVESESLDVTRAGTILGTPLYMSPEQCAGESKIGPEADVYSMGASLYTLLAGRPPFEGDSPLIVMAMHRSEPPPDLRAFAPSISDAAVSIVSKALAKTPERRYTDARDMLDDIERLLRGEPTGLDVHPRLPSSRPGDVVSFDWRWDMEASPRALWPYVSNTERFNRAIGLSPANFSDTPDPEGGTQKSGQFRKSGFDFAWREHPFEWIEGRRMGVVREFTTGPFEWFVSIVELEPKSGGGTTLMHRLRVKPRGILGRTIAAVELGKRGRKGIDRVYRRIDATLTGKLGRDPTIDPYEPPEPLTGERRKKLEKWLDRLGEADFAPAVVERLGDFLETASAQEVARIRPLALARKLGVDADAVVAACLKGAADGILVLLWDILCPVCRIPSQVMETLRSLRDHGRCDTCRLDYELDFANSVELIFRVHPDLRETDLGTYCVGSPSHSPHVAAQARVGPGERIMLDLALEVGSYRLRGPQLSYAIDFRVETLATTRRWDLDLKRGPSTDLPRTLRAGGQVFDLNNANDTEILVRVERIAPREDALTAARASSLALFRELFPGEVLSPGQLINLDTVTLLVTDLDHPGDLYAELGDARAFGIIHEQFRRIDECIRREGGALVKTVHEGTVSAFTDPGGAVRAALSLPTILAETDVTQDLEVRVAVHRGAAMVATLNDHLDYFGTTVSVASKLTSLARGGQVVLTYPVASDPRVASLLLGKRLDPAILEAEIEGLAEPFVQVVEVIRRH